MNKKYSPEMRERALRMLAETRPSHPNMMSAVRHVAGLLGMSPETLRLWQRRYEVGSGVKPGLTAKAQPSFVTAASCAGSWRLIWLSGFALVRRV